MSKDKSIVKAQEQTVALFDYGQDANSGFEGMDMSHFTIPSIQLAQQAKQLKKSTGAQLGDFINSVTHEHYKELTVIPCATEHSFVEWEVQPDNTKRFVGQYQPFSPFILDLKSKSKDHFKMVNGKNPVVETFSVYVLMLIDSRLEYAKISFASTQVKRYRQWMTLARARQPIPLFGFKYKVTSTPDSNAKGDFYSWNIEVDVAVDPSSREYAQARGYKNSVLAGHVKTAVTESAEQAKDDVPF